VREVNYLIIKRVRGQAMTKYVTNLNGDWWQVVEGDCLTIIDTDNPLIKQAMEEEGVSDGDDKFEDFIATHGDSFPTI